MFLKNHLVLLASRFLWWGLVLGMIYIICAIVIRAFKRNVYISNLISFCFWLAFGFIFIILCNSLYNYQFCWFGLLSMFLGLLLVKFSINFFFTKFVELLYNKLAKLKSRKKKNGKLQTNEKG